MDIKLVSRVIFVKDIPASRQFYEEILNQKVMMDHGLNVGFEGGFAIWQMQHATEILFGEPVKGEPVFGTPNAELYFEADNLDEVCDKLAVAGIKLVHPLREMPWGQRVIRFYDPDQHILEVGEPMNLPIFRFLSQGMTAEEIASRTAMPVEYIQMIVAAQ